MPKQAKTEYEKATTELGTKVLDECRNEMRALLGIVETRCKFDATESMVAVRDAFRMLLAGKADERSAQLQAQLESLSKQIQGEA